MNLVNPENLVILSNKDHADLFEVRIFCDAGKSRAEIYGGVVSVVDAGWEHGCGGSFRQDLQDLQNEQDIL